MKYTDPLHAGRHPFQTYLLSLAVVSAAPLMFGQNQPGSISASLPPWLALTWGVMLFTGALAALVGSYWLGDYADALTVERIGLLFVGAAACVYAAAIVALAQLGGLLAAGITLGFGLACLRRSHDIAKIIHEALKRTAP